MAGPLSVLVFPYTDLPEMAWERLGSAFGRITVLQAAGMEPSAALEGDARAELILPGAEGIGPEEIRAILAEAGNWVQSVRDIKEISHLKAVLSQDREEGSALALATAIRRHGKDREDTGMLDHLLLHLAAWQEERQREADRAVSRLGSKEEALRQSLGSGAGEDGEEPVFAAIDPLAPKEGPADPLLGMRLEAWARLFGQAPVEADLWITGRGVLSIMAEAYEERFEKPPISLRGLDPEQAGGILAGTGLEELLEERYAFLEPWLFTDCGRESLVGLTPTGEDRPALIGVLEI